jgi:hypothetical protein
MGHCGVFYLCIRALCLPLWPLTCISGTPELRQGQGATGQSHELTGMLRKLAVLCVSSIVNDDKSTFAAAGQQYKIIILLPRVGS